VHPDGDVELAGNIWKGGKLFIHNRGTANTALGDGALALNATGGGNVAVGSRALNESADADYNVAVGLEALFHNRNRQNTAVGAYALWGNTGESNTAIGYQALRNISGQYNIAVGEWAGSDLTTGHSNIMIGNRGVAGEANTTRLGSPSQYRTFVSGVRGVITGAADAVNVVIDSNGQLGTISSSRRFKQDIAAMGEASSGLLRLRPVTFRYKQPYSDGSKPIDYGLIAEEVAESYPDLVVKGADGEVETVLYQKLTPMLLNELQKLHHQSQCNHNALQAAQEEIRALKAMLTEVIAVQKPGN
jgi:hypothetical protein